MSRARAVFCRPGRSTKAGSGTLSVTVSSSTTTAIRSSATTSTTPAPWRSCPMNDAGEVLLIKQYRHPVGMDLWEIPAGLLDVEGEDFVAGAARELAEEADLIAGQWNVLADFFNSPGSSSEAIRIYLARGLSDVPGHELHVRTDEEAEIELHWIPLDDAVLAVLEGRLHNPSAVVGILAAAAARADDFKGLRPGRRAVARASQPALMVEPLTAEPAGSSRLRRTGGQARRSGQPARPARRRGRPRHDGLPAAHGRGAGARGQHPLRVPAGPGPLRQVPRPRGPPAPRRDHPARRHRLRPGALRRVRRRLRPGCPVGGPDGGGRARTPQVLGTRRRHSHRPGQRCPPAHARQTPAQGHQRR